MLYDIILLGYESFANISKMHGIPLASGGNDFYIYAQLLLYSDSPESSILEPSWSSYAAISISLFDLKVAPAEQIGCGGFYTVGERVGGVHLMEVLHDL